MGLRVWLKRHAADRALSPVRRALADRIKPGMSVLDVGCGTGDFLFRTASRLGRGLGVDMDKDMIRYAEEKRRAEGINNISFIHGDICSEEVGDFDIATSTLCLHEVGEDAACRMLRVMADSSEKILVADFTSASSLLGKAGIELDEFFSGHYLSYRKYRKRGEMPYYAGKAGVEIKDVVKTESDGISIWILDGHRKV